MVWVQYPRRSAVFSRLNHCKFSSQFRGRPVKETIANQRKDNLAVWRLADVVLHRCSPATLRVLLLMKTLENDRSGPQKLMTKSSAEF